MSKIIIANCNPVLDVVQDGLSKKYLGVQAKSKADLTVETVSAIAPDYIFFLHWSWIIPEELFLKYNCVVFHMTDLPYGRGGSPLQNLILRGHETTKITAIKVDKGIDTGDIYLKKDLSLEGTAREIFLRAGNVIREMIEEILCNSITPVKQVGDAVLFTRRKPEQSLISDEITAINQLYDFIRMLDADGYPQAFLENRFFKFEFENAQIVDRNELVANVRITKK